MVSKIARFLARRGSYLQYVQEKPSWFFVLLLGRLIAVRRINSLIRKGFQKSQRADGDRRVNVPSMEGALDALRNQGLYCGLTLSEQDRGEIQDFASRQRCGTLDTSEPMFFANEYERVNRSRPHDILAAYYFDHVTECEAISRIESDPSLYRLSEAYLGANPVHIRTRLWWNFPASRICEADLFRSAQNAFHFDLNDWRTLKFFFYLTDCDASSGAHRCIPGSHRKRKLSHQFSLFAAQPVAELEEYYGRDSVLSVEGEAGFGFAEDPFLYHTGTVCEDRPRLILEVEFGNRELGPSYKYGKLG